MDSEVALALMTKVKLVFERAGNFLSFPLSTIAYKKSDLSFVQGELTEDRLLKLKDFSLLVNQIPDGTLWPSTEEQYLWDVYYEVLKLATLAPSAHPVTPEQTAAFEAAHKFLKEPLPDGSEKDSQAALTYRQYEDRWLQLQAKYKSDGFTAQSAADAAVKQRWETVDEPLLKQQLLDLEQEWATKGYKAEVEQARRLEEQRANSSPATIWEEWRKQFIPDIVKWTDVRFAQDFCPTGYSPSNTIESTGWNKFTLSDSEVSGLLEQAPPELKNRLGSDQIDLDIASLSFEVCSVKVERAWFVSDVFRSRFWKMPDNSLLSNGQTPSNGKCPSYVVALILARNLEIKLSPESSKNAQNLGKLQTMQALSLGTFKVAAPLVATPVGQPVVLHAAKPAVSNAFRPVAPAAKPAAPAGMQFRRAAPQVMGARPAPPASMVMVRPQSATVLRMQQKVVVALPPSSPQKPPTPSPPPTAPVEDIYVLAFICKKLSLCPNPDPALQW
jgi:hypothetical protein